MNDDATFNEPSEVEALEGVVTVNGPDGVDVKLTPDAALETSDRLLEKSNQARGQTYLSDRGMKGPKKSSN
ncbi:hypothetical protein SH584_04115 [Sphingomonas sp. LY29]|uniref:hypothetical protein n=1 Tax=Sphingomonas sp. LY29 TaxID=3095341 RepID=UPI002D796596|nr:hypothetical protein [Sphingomonas sp. LY29]WRP26627.1 hypothetical protein SH584_04115 [Sphingomonas sp. LY29]